MYSKLLLAPICTFLVFLISWKLFEWFSWSRSSSYHSSRWTYYKKKLGFCLTNSLIAFCVSVYLFAGKSDPIPNSRSLENTPSTSLNLNSNTVNGKNSTLIVESNQSLPKLNTERPAQVMPEKVETNAITPEELKELEDKAQYHGDDPIVRKRLGLPPKNP